MPPKPAAPDKAGGSKHAKKPISKNEQKSLDREVSSDSKHPSPEKPQPPGYFKSAATSRVKNIYSHAGAVKAEFLIGLVLLLLSPIGNPQIKIDMEYVKRLIAYCLLFMVLFPMGSSGNPTASRLASGFGGVFLLTMVVYSPSKGFAVNFSTLITTIVAKLQPKSQPA